MATVLIEFPSGAGVLRLDDGEIELVRDIKQARGQPLQLHDRFLPAQIWLDGERSLVAGLLAAGAVSAEVVEITGRPVPAVVRDDCYAAIVDEPNDGMTNGPIVCFRDASGEPVRRPMPGVYPSKPVTDAQEPCPGCGATDYEECLPTEQWRAGQTGPDGSRIPGPIVVCRVCGYEEPAGGIFRFRAPEGEGEAGRAERIARGLAQQRVQRWYSDKLTLRAVSFPIYAVEGWPARITGSGSQGDDLTELTIAHLESKDTDLFDQRPQIEVTTSTQEPFADELAVARQRLESWITEEINGQPADDLSDAALTLWFRSNQRRRRAGAAGAQTGEAHISIDGNRELFLTLTTPSGRWVAVRRHAGVTVTVAARDLDSTTITLEPIANPDARLLGPEPNDS